MKKQLILFFVIMVTVITLAQVQLIHDELSWRILLQSILAGMVSTLFFWLIIRKRKKR